MIKVKFERVKCPICKKLFQIRNHKIQRYCSMECVYKLRSQQMKGNVCGFKKKVAQQ